MTLGEIVTGFGSSRIEWGRTGSTIDGRRTLDITGRARQLIITVRLRELADLGVRGVLLVLVDGLVMVLIAALSAGVLHGIRVSPALLDAMHFRSYRIRIALALAGFFVLPTVGFAMWSLGRIRSDADRSRDLLIRESLNDAAIIISLGLQFGIEPRMLGKSLSRVPAGFFDNTTEPTSVIGVSASA